jgi:phosphoserine phosphatase
MPQMLSRALVLTAAPLLGSIGDDFVAGIEASVLVDRHVLQTRRLAPTAWEALFLAAEDEDLGPCRESTAALAGALPIDVNIVPDDLAYRRKRLLVADMESTIIEQEVLDELAGHVGLRAEISAITERAMRGELDFAAALAARVKLLAGLEAHVLDAVWQRVTLMPGAETLVGTMKAHGAICALVSGGFTIFTERLAQRLGFDQHQANVLEIVDGRLTGRVVPPILGREAKLAALQGLAAAEGLDLALTLAVGDGANDLDMIAAAGLGVAFRAKPKVEAEARARMGGAVITHGDLTALLYLQGYGEAELRRA